MAGKGLCSLLIFLCLSEFTKQLVSPCDKYLLQLLSIHLLTDLSRQDSKLRCVMVKGGEISWKRDRCRGLDYVDYCILNFLGLNFKVENG